MLPHPAFKNILLHSDDELAQLLGVGITRRETIHLWPLSCVDKLTLADGTKRVYKSQLPPTLEPHFYEVAQSPLLIGYQRLGKLGACETMTLDWIDAPLLRDVVQGETSLIEHGRRVIEQIGALSGSVPIYVNIGSAEAWLSLIENIAAKSRHLIADGRFKSIDNDTLDRVRVWGNSSRVIDVLHDSRLAHGDLTADQVFVTGDGYRVIDWQRPIFAPPEVDLVALLVSRKIDPRRYIAAEIVQIYWLLLLRWAVEAQFDLFPNERWPIFNQWAAQATSEILRP